MAIKGIAEAKYQNFAVVTNERKRPKVDQMQMDKISKWFCNKSLIAWPVFIK